MSFLLQKPYYPWGCFPDSQVVSATWFYELCQVFELVKPFVRTCWLKTCAGVWCTSFRFRHMAGSVTRPCIFGCNQADDSLKHYLVCPLLWQFVVSHYGHEDNFGVAHRLGLLSPTVAKLKRLAMCHYIYSQVCNHPDFCMLLIGFVVIPVFPSGC